MTLTEAVFWTKKVGMGLLIALLIFLPLRLIFSILGIGLGGGDGKIAAKATLGFGTLPDIGLTSLTLPENITPSFQLETAAGEFPEIPSVIQVYKMEQKEQGLFALDVAKARANAFGFTTEPSRNPGTSEYVWTDNSGRILTYDIATQSFMLKTDFTKDSNKSLNSSVPLIEAKAIAKSYLSQEGLLGSDYLNGYQSAAYLKVDEKGQYIKASSQVEATLVRVDFFRNANLVKLSDEDAKLLDDYSKGIIELEPDQIPQPYPASVLTEDVYKSNIYVIFRGKDIAKIGGIYEFGYTNWGIDYSTTETYYTKTPAEAWDEVKSGKAYLRYLLEKTGEPYIEYRPIAIEQFLVYEVSLAYFESKVEEEYMQPVYLLRGEAKLVGDTGKPKIDFVFMTSALKK